MIPLLIRLGSTSVRGIGVGSRKFIAGRRGMRDWVARGFHILDLRQDFEE